MFDIAEKSFYLPDSFIKNYKDKQPDWGPIGYFTFKRTYARKTESSTEEYWETCKRVVEGTFSIQKNHCKRNHLFWDERKAGRASKLMFQLMWDFKFLPPGRGLWSMGTDIVKQKGGAALNNCAFVSTKNIDTEYSKPFRFVMDMSMLGVGCGFDTKGADKIIIPKQITKESGLVCFIQDTREGWVQALGDLIDACLKGTPIPTFDYSKVRPAGAPIKTFGGTASGPEPLKRTLDEIKNLLLGNTGKPITSTIIVDIMNMIGRCVVAGSSRRSAEIALGSPEDKEFVLLKQDKEKLLSYRWCSNNSIFAEVGMNYNWHAEQTSTNGEPGYFWLENARAYGRTKDPADWADKEAEGTNPCQPSWATILTPKGIRTIADINIGDLIWSGNKWTKIVNKWSTGIKEVFSYKTNAGIFYGTENHRVVSNSQKKPVCQADCIDICTGESNDSTVFDNQDVVDGLVVGDGSVHKASNNLVYLIIGQDDHSYFDDEVSNYLLKRRQGLESGSTDQSWEIKTTITHEELPKTYLRSVPNRFIFGDKNKVAGFLRGIFSANGSVCGQRVTLKTASIKLVEQIQLMLSFLGIKSYYTTNKSKDVKFSNGVYTSKTSYDINITTDRELFSKIIGFIQPYKNIKLDKIIQLIGNGRNKKSYGIKNVEFISEEEVFDLTVDDENHTYWTGGLLVSNCSEQVLFSGELCTLVETFPARHNNFEEYLETLKIAYLYAKTVTLVPTHWAETNAVMTKNRRIGLSQSGIIKAFNKHGRRKMLEWCDKGYEFVKGLDIQYSNWLGVPRSIKRTSVKPSGTVSLLPGEPPGIHYPHSEFYIRRVRCGLHSSFWKDAKKAGYKVEPAKGQESDTMVVSFPVKEEYFTRSKNDVSIWEQVANAIVYQKFWADNSVSITVTFKPEEKEDIKHILELHEDSLKGISFLPISDHGYDQPPYEEIDEQTYLSMVENLKPIVFTENKDSVSPKFCDGDACEI